MEGKEWEGKGRHRRVAKGHTCSFDTPPNPKSWIHPCGRSGRFLGIADGSYEAARAKNAESGLRTLYIDAQLNL